MRLLILISAMGMAAGSAGAQVVTPQGCHWVAAAERTDTVALWCRGPDGRARPTGQTLVQGPASGDGCPGGLMYDGAACVTEDQAMATPRWASRRSEIAAAPVRATPRVMVLADRRGRATRGLACVDQRDVTICRPIARR